MSDETDTPDETANADNGPASVGAQNSNGEGTPPHLEIDAKWPAGYTRPSASRPPAPAQPPPPPPQYVINTGSEDDEDRWQQPKWAIHADLSRGEPLSHMSEWNYHAVSPDGMHTVGSIWMRQRLLVADESVLWTPPSETVIYLDGRLIVSGYLEDPRGTLNSITNALPLSHEIRRVGGGPDQPRSTPVTRTGAADALDIYVERRRHKGVRMYAVIEYDNLCDLERPVCMFVDEDEADDYAEQRHQELAREHERRTA